MRRSRPPKKRPIFAAGSRQNDTCCRFGSPLHNRHLAIIHQNPVIPAILPVVGVFVYDALARTRPHRRCANHSQNIANLLIYVNGLRKLTILVIFCQWFTLHTKFADVVNLRQWFTIYTKIVSFCQWFTFWHISVKMVSNVDRRPFAWHWIWNRY